LSVLYASFKRVVCASEYRRSCGVALANRSGCSLRESARNVSSSPAGSSNEGSKPSVANLSGCVPAAGAGCTLAQAGQRASDAATAPPQLQHVLALMGT